MRVKITMACQECKDRNYHITKNKRLHPERIEFRKYCRKCNNHTTHKETR